MICDMCFKKIYLKEVHGDADTSWITLSAAALHAICVQQLLHSIGDLLRHFEAKHGIVARRDKLKFNLLKGKCARLVFYLLYRRKINNNAYHCYKIRFGPRAEKI
ncbi:uncharacterized protein ISCGN_018328 [Ixodes scapularis]